MLPVSEVYKRKGRRQSILPDFRKKPDYGHKVKLPTEMKTKKLCSICGRKAVTTFKDDFRCETHQACE